MSIDRSQALARQALNLLEEHKDDLSPAQRALILATLAQVEATLTLTDYVMSTLPTTSAQLMDVAGIFSTLLPKFERTVINLANTLDR
jgi:hypothetical protein